MKEELNVNSRNPLCFELFNLPYNTDTIAVSKVDENGKAQTNLDFVGRCLHSLSWFCLFQKEFLCIMGGGNTSKQVLMLRIFNLHD